MLSSLFEIIKFTLIFILVMAVFVAIPIIGFLLATFASIYLVYILFSLKDVNLEMTDDDEGPSRPLGLSDIVRENKRKAEQSNSHNSQ